MKDLLEILLDADNREPIVLTDETGKETEFAQVAVIPYDVGEDRYIYAVLKPIDEFEGLNDDEVVIFRLDEDEIGNVFLRIESDMEIAEKIFAQLTELMDAELKKAAAESDGQKPKNNKNEDDD